MVISLYYLMMMMHIMHAVHAHVAISKDSILFDA